MNKRIFIIVFLIFSFVGKTFPLTMFRSEHFNLDIHPSEKRVLNELRLGRFKRNLYFAVFYLFKNTAPYFQRYKNILRKIANNSEFQNAKTTMKKADMILRLLHEFLFKSYIENDPRVYTVMTKGLFNCVSSTTLYNLTCQHFGIKTGAAVVPSHVFSVVYIGNKRYEVETTVRYGFNAGNSRKIKDALKKITGYVRVPPSRGKRDYINNFQLISFLYSQKANLLASQNKYAESIKNYIRSLMVYPSNAPGVEGTKFAYHKLALQYEGRGNIIKGINIMLELAGLFSKDYKAGKAAQYFFNNILVGLLKKSRYKRFFRITDYYNSNTLLKNVIKKIEPDAYRAYVDSYQKKNNYKLALMILKKGYRKYPTLKELEPLIYKNWIISYLRNSQYEKAIKLVDLKVKEYKELNEYYFLAYTNNIATLIKNSQFDSAFNVAKKYYYKTNKSVLSSKLLVKFINFYLSKLSKNENFSRADKVLEEAKNILPEEILKPIQIRFYIASSNVLLKKGRLSLAVDYFLKGFHASPEVTIVKKYSKDFAVRVVYFARKNRKFSSLKNYLDKIRPILKRKYTNEAYAQYYYYLALNNFNSNKIDMAYKNIKTGFTYINFKYLYSILYRGTVNVVNFYLKNNIPDKAVYYADKALSISRNASNFINLYKQTVFNVVNAYISVSKRKQARRILIRAKKRLNNDYDINRALRKLDTR